MIVGEDVRGQRTELADAVKVLTEIECQCELKLALVIGLGIQLSNG